MARLFLDREPLTQYKDRLFKGSMEEYLERLRTSATLYVGNVSFYTSEEQIWDLFSRAGPVKAIVMGLDKNLKTPCGFCFVEYHTRPDAERAVKYLNGTKLDDREVRMDFDWGFVEGRQFGRGKSGGQVRDEYRTTYDEGRGGYGKLLKTELDALQNEEEESAPGEGSDDVLRGVLAADGLLSSSSTTAREARRLEAALACVSQLTSGKSAGKSSASVLAGLAFQETLVDELASENTPLARDSRAVREEAAKVASALAGAHLAPEGARRPAELEASGTETLERLRAKTAALLESFAAGADAASRAALLDNPAASSASAAPAEAEARAARSRRWLEGVLLTVIQLAKHGDVACPAASDVVARCIPAILRAQEAPDRDFALVAKRALTYLKYVVFPPARCRLAARGVLLGLQDDNWHARAAALKFAQAFAFRHAFLLDGASRESLRERVVEATRDPQIEVRALASATLVGFTRGPDAADGSAARFRSAALKRASEAFEAFSGVRMFKTHLQDNGAMLDAHSSVLLLASCVLSAPYDVPGWMPAALEALSRWASSPSAPVRETVQRTFGEFKKTHQDTWLETKAAFTSEQWENVSAGMELAPSYIS